ncbi:MAG TPA: nucleotidyltransferase family protein [Allosphingosinicella sp.]|nr:nucleotidyltransferase family protein [Allosphingosinicella sp.]
MSRLLVRILSDPAACETLGPAEWTALITAARAESLLGSLAFRLEGGRLPVKVAAILEDARRDAAYARTQALWEAEMARRALAGTEVPVILLKGTAFAAAGLDASRGRSIGDLDILVPFDRLDAVQEALLVAGWEWVKEDAYDDLYYRRWMHELPPLIHRSRDRMIDVHHTILPPTARPTPDAAALIAASVPLDSGLLTLSPEDMIVHAAAHLFADGDLAGGLRNLWDINCLVREFATKDKSFWPRLGERARLHQLRPAVARALRLARSLFGTPLGTPNSFVPSVVEERTLGLGASAPRLRSGRTEAGAACDGTSLAGRRRLSDRLFEARLLARNGWGQPTRRALRFAFYLRSHWMRMPPLMLAQHLLTKATR